MPEQLLLLEINPTNLAPDTELDWEGIDDYTNINRIIEEFSITNNKKN